MNYTASDITEITGGRLTGNPDLLVSELVTDSRQVSFAENAAFIAIRGKNHDGHQFLDVLYNKGIRVFIVEELPENPGLFPGAAFVKTNGSVAAMQALAAHKRALFRSHVIAITGSSGKTIVKEWLADILGRCFAVIRSPKSYNSQIGVPLSVWKLEEKYDYGIFEAGISFPGEMEKLERIILPETGIITNIGDSHSENFPDNRTKASEKLKLFINASTIIYCSDHEIVNEIIESDRVLNRKTLIDWSFRNQKAKVFAKVISLEPDHTILEITYNNITSEFKIPFSDRASIENAVTVAAACLSSGLEIKTIREGFSQLTSVAMRMDMKNGINNCQLIEDYYNSDPGSLVMAIDFLQLQKTRRTTLILSDFVQSGREEKELYGEVASLVRKSGIEKFIGIGPALYRNRSKFEKTAKFHHSTDDFILNFRENEFRDETILIKGARIFELERIGKILEQQVHITVLEINLDAIAENLSEFRKHLYPSTRIMAMVKAFAYGTGSSEIASFLEYHRVSYLGVAYSDEGADLRKSGITMPIMVMNPDISSYDTIVQYNLEPEIYSFPSLEKFNDTAFRNGLIDYPVHLKIDSGMHRLGFMPSEVVELTSRLKNVNCLKVISVFTHLAASEDPEYDSFTHGQVETYLNAVGRIREALGYSFLRHVLNTSGIIRFPQYQFEMVRPGIGIYGAGRFKGLMVKPVSRFVTRISQIKKIPAGEPVGYGCADVSDKDRLVAILPVGYADGLNRKLGNLNGNLFIKGVKAPLIGNICMDMCMADVTGSEAREGDEAEIFGQNIPIDEIAIKCETIPYEILTSIPGRVKRVYFRG